MVLRYRQWGQLERFPVAWFAIVLLFCLGLSGAVAAGENASVRLANSQFVFSRRVPNGAWTPLASRLENNSDSAREVAIVTDMQVGGQGAERVSFSRLVRMPPHSERTVETFVLMDYPPRAVTPLFTKEAETVEYTQGPPRTVHRYKADVFEFLSRVVDVENGNTLSQSSFFATPLHPATRLYAVADGRKPDWVTAERYEYRGMPFVLGEHDSDLSYLVGREWPEANLFANRLLPDESDVGMVLQNARLSLEHLPGKWAAYEGVGVLFLGSLRSLDTGLPELSAQQRHSLLRYVRAGGRVVIMPGFDLESYQDPFWRQLLPVRLLGVRPLHDELKVLEETYGGTITMDRDLPLRLVEAVPREEPGCETLLAHEGLSLLAHRRVGSGDVYFLAVTGDTVQDWREGYRMMSRIFRPRLDPAPGLRTHLPAHASAFLGHIVGAEAPSRTLILLLFGGYFLVGSLLLVVLRMRGRAEQAWPLLLLMALVVAGVAVGLGKHSAAKVGFVTGEIGVTVLGNNDANGSAISFVGFYPPESREADVRWSNPDTLASLHSTWEGEGRVGRTLRVRQDNHFTFEEMRLNRLELATARTMTLVRYGEGVALDIRADETGLHGSVTNRTGYRLQDCLLHVNRRWLRVGDLAEGEEQSFTSEDLVWDPGLSGLGSSERDKVRGYILAEVLRPSDPERSLRERSYAWPVALYGWVDVPQTAPEVPEVQPRRSALQLLVAPAADVQAEGTVRLPPGTCGLRLLSGGGAFAYGSPDLLQSRYPDVAFPQKTVLAGMSRRESSRSAADSGGQRFVTSPASPEPETPAARHVLPEWGEGSLMAKVRVAFDPPAGLPPLDVTAMTLHIDMDVRGLEASVGVRKPGTRRATKLEAVDLSGGRVQVEVPDLKRYFGPEGQWPEFELELRASFGAQPAQPGYWAIRVFDIEVEGRVRETATP